MLILFALLELSGVVMLKYGSMGLMLRREVWLDRGIGVL